MIERYNYTGEGYHPCLIRENWQAAILNYIPGQAFDRMDRVERHLLTDEVFILLSGKALLIEATFGKEGIRFDTIPMEKGIIYNVPEGVWHNIALEKEAIVFIFENAGTHLRDCEYYSLTGEQQQLLDQLILHPAT